MDGSNVAGHKNQELSIYLKIFGVEAPRDIINLSFLQHSITHVEGCNDLYLFSSRFPLVVPLTQV